MNKFIGIIIVSIGVFYSNIIFAISLDIPKPYVNRLSIIAVDANNNQLMYSYESSTPRLIASNMKLFTTLIALEKLKPDYRYTTNLYYTGYIIQNTLYGNVYLQGSGDPSLVSGDLYQLFAVLKNKGIRQIKGNIILDNSVFNSTSQYSMLTNDAYDVDTVLPSGLIVDGNIAKLKLKLYKKHMSIDSNLFGYKIVNHLSVNYRQSGCSEIYKRINLILKDNKVLEVNGVVPYQCGGRTLLYNLLPTDVFNIMSVRRTLAYFGINLGGTYIFDSTPNTANLLATHSSVNLAQMIIEMTYFSVNLMAETLLLTIGVNESATGNAYKVGKQVYIKFLQDHGLYNKALQLENGAGLSRYEMFSVNNIAGLLLMAENSPLQAIFEASLPTPDGENTLKHTLNKFAGRLYIKTGTLNDTRAYSGYYYAKNGHKYVVSMIGNINTQDVTNMQEFDRLFSQLLTQLD